MLRAFDSPRTLGKTGLSVSSIALGSSYGVAGRDIERAFDHGVNTFLYGSLRRPGFAKGVRALAKHREKTVIAIQTYSRVGFLMKPFVWTALRSLGTDYVDVLGLAWWNDVPSRRIWDAALALKEQGLVRHVMVSCHHRPSFESFMSHEACEAWMVRYNAGHEVFPLLGEDVSARPGVFAFTATRWGSLLKGAPGEKTPTATDCYRFALSAPRVDSVITGPKDARELDQAMQAMQLGPMSDEELAWMKRVGAHARMTGANRGVGLLDRISGWVCPPKQLAS